QKNFPSGKIISVMYRKKGEIFGGAAPILDQPHQSDVIAKENSEIILIHKNVLIDLLYKNNTFHKMLSLAATHVTQLN
ncbi:hypothetical protein NL523_29360, partial [Klebsiella pneumoniae]|nr:hypothetical protein [Klebsiella pneumoniae]MCP6663858.1 hypothetical protein [Klebsiella pneumoniae]